MSLFKEDGQGLGRELAERTGQLELADDYHGIQNVLGIAPRETPGPYMVDYGINVASRLLMNNIKASGSFMSTESGTSAEHMGKKSIFLRQLQPLLRRKVNWRKNPKVNMKNVLTRVGQTLNVVVNEGALRMDKLSAPGHGYLKILQGIMGANLDIHGYDNLGDVDESVDILRSLLRVGYTYCVSNDGPTILCKTNTFNRLTNLHITSPKDTYSGGINFMCLPKDWVERFTTMLSFRIGQTGLVEWVEKGMRAKADQTLLDEKIAMVGQPETKGEWLMHTARAIRVAVMHGFDEERIDVESFNSKIPIDQEMGFEAVVGIVDNMIVAHAHNPELTVKLIEKLGLWKYFDKAKLSEVRKGLTLADKELFGIGKGQALGNLFEQHEKREAQEFNKMQDLAELITWYMPVSEEEFERLVPAPDRRERIEGEMIGREAGLWQHNHKALKTYLVDGKEVICHYIEMEGVVALDKMIAVGIAQKIPQKDIQHMINDRNALWRVAPWGGGII